MKRVTICGFFDYGRNNLNGQTVKTKILTEGLIDLLGRENVSTIDTAGLLNKIFSFARLILALIVCKNIIIMPAQNGIRYYPCWLSFWNCLFRRRLHYVVIGGWLPVLLDKNPRVMISLTKFYGVYVETSTMKRMLEDRGLKNVTILKNCKKLEICDKYTEVNTAPPFKLVTFSRVMEQKGIGNIANIVQQINEEENRILFELDIYGQIDSKETEWFDDLKKSFPNYIQYKGLVPFDKSVEVLKSYFALVFPTKFFTEGIPGTIIDSYAAGVPVISSRWESFQDVVYDGITGLGFEFENWDELKNLLLKISKTPSTITNLKLNCTQKAIDFLPENVLPELAKNLS